MSKLKSLKIFIFLFFAQLAVTSTAFGASINTTNLDAQDKALITTSGLAGNYSLANIISVLIQTVLGFLGIIFLALTIMAGFKWMTSNGNEETIKKAKSSLMNAIIGLVIVIAAYAITYSVFNYLPFTSSGGGAGGSSVTS